jgi:hypothetical protein
MENKTARYRDSLLSLKTSAWDEREVFQRVQVGDRTAKTTLFFARA